MCNYVSISNRSIKGDLEHIQKGDLEEQKCGLLRWLRGKALVTKPEDVSSILRTHMMEGKKQFYALSSDSTHVLWHVCAPLNTYTSNSQVNAKNNNKNRSKTDKNLLGGGLWFSFPSKNDFSFSLEMESFLDCFQTLGPDGPPGSISQVASDWR